MKNRTQAPRNRSGATFTIGRTAFAKISSVEGIRTTPAMDAEFQEFDRRGLSAEQRRRVIGKKYAKVR